MPDSFDVIIIGSGPGGYVCAIRAAQLGMKVACVEKRATLGGTCLNIGCIPSKALLQSSEEFHHAAHALKDHGVLVDGVKLDLARMQARKGEVVSANVKGVEFLFRKNKVTWLKGTGRIAGPGKVDVDGTTYDTKHIVIATGSESVPLAGVDVDEKQIVTSTGGLELDTVPGHLVVIGGGYIGLELGSVWRRLGAQVTVVEFLDRIVPTMDGEIAKAFERILTRQGIKFRLGMKVTGARKGNDGVTLDHRACEGRQRGGAEGRHRAAVDRAPAVYRRRRAGRCRRGAGRTRPGEDRRTLRHQRPRHLRDRRRHRRSDAGAQGGGGRRRARRTSGRPGGARELRRHSRRGLHLAGGRRGRPDRGGAEGRRCRLQRRQIPVHRQCAAPAPWARRMGS